MLKYIIFVCTLLAPTTSFADDGTGNGNWDGFQLGISGGIGIMSGSDDIGNEQSLSSGIAGVFAGYSHSFNRVVVGLEADVNLSNFTSSTNASRSKAQWNAIGTARIGYDVGGILPYLSIGIGLLAMK
ncbi:outer membrane beta-barrel protein [Pseudovibrio sp. Tun.PSC04-5.I4]|uniref:outer membrane protein n=1 Tax=Pseudovibrio sp. Tun.PSC04-5.I4 TaxID=1798213 RepID=UPI000B89D7A4|nr:outer membrane beta-barrel protein [Pseudovibrio sp. Tun.PSC04-5.I4]